MEVPFPILTSHTAASATWPGAREKKKTDYKARPRSPNPRVHTGAGVQQTKLPRLINSGPRVCEVDDACPSPRWGLSFINNQLGESGSGNARARTAGSAGDRRGAVGTASSRSAHVLSRPEYFIRPGTSCRMEEQTACKGSPARHLVYEGVQQLSQLEHAPVERISEPKPDRK